MKPSLENSLITRFRDISVSDEAARRRWLKLRRDLAGRCPVVFTRRTLLPSCLRQAGRGWGGVDIMAVSQGKGRTQIRYTRLPETQINTSNPTERSWGETHRSKHKHRPQSHAFHAML